MRTKLMTLAAENGFSHAAPVDMNALTPRREVREMCRADRCGQWNANWACPPGCGTLEDAAAAMGCFDAGVLVQTTGTLADDFDYEGMEAIQRRHKRAFADFARQARLRLPASVSRGVHRVPTVYLSGPTLPVPGQADVLHGGLRTVGGGRVPAVRAVI